jgi:pimeloyl-ACP methyl ester carboxylesterase
MSSPVSIAANGLEFSGLQWGPPDGSRVLCLHGFPQRSTSWTGVASRLADTGAHVVAVDQRGYSPGARPPDVASYALAHLVADVVATIEALGGPVHLVGHDWGGVVGWQVAARRPDLLTGWTAVSTPNQLALNDVLAGDPGQRARFGYILRFRQVGAAEQELLGSGGAGLAAVYGGHVPPERVAEDVAFFSAPGVLTAALNWYRAMSPSDADGLGPVLVPTTYVWGSEDQAFGAEAATLTGTFVHAPYRFVALDGASHWLPDEAPDTLADAIASSLQPDGG